MSILCRLGLHNWEKRRGGFGGLHTGKVDALRCKRCERTVAEFTTGGMMNCETRRVPISQEEWDRFAVSE